MSFVIYAIADPRCRKIIYIGHTSRLDLRIEQLEASETIVFQRRHEPSLRFRNMRMTLEKHCSAAHVQIVLFFCRRSSEMEHWYEHREMEPVTAVIFVVLVVALLLDVYGGIKVLDAVRSLF